jgi:ribosomal protein S18 acetylase RimI-like enzyme
MLSAIVIRKALAEDIAALEVLVNSAYRGEASKQGWTTEADLLLGERRTDASVIAALLQEPHSVILVAEDGTGQLLGCVYLRQESAGLYLGMLSVVPQLQGGGVGKQLMAAAEAHAKAVPCDHIFMSVISVRHELIAWYQRLGYAPTGETKPFPTDERYGIPTQPLEFVILRKSMG